MPEDRREKYESEQRSKLSGLIPRSIRLDAESRALLAEASKVAGNQNRAIKLALKKFLGKA